MKSKIKNRYKSSKPFTKEKKTTTKKGSPSFVDFPVFYKDSLKSDPIQYYDRVTREFKEADPYRKRGGRYTLGYVKCCPEWHAETVAKIKSLFKENGIKSSKQIDRAVDVVMFILRAQTICKCGETAWTYRNKKDSQWVGISYSWFANKFFHSKTACVKTLQILRDAKILLTDHSWVNVPKTDEEKALAGWKWDEAKRGPAPENRPQGWLVNYHPKSERDKWVDVSINYDRNELTEMIRQKAEEVGEIDAGQDDMPLYLDVPAIVECLNNGTIEPMQTLRDIGLCKKYATRESWKNPAPKLNKDGTLKTKQRRPTDMREYHAAAMVSKAFLYNCITGKKGTKYEGTHIKEVCDLHTGVIPSTLLAEIIRAREISAVLSDVPVSSIPTYKELKPLFKAIEHLQGRRVKINPDGSMSVTRDGDVYMDAVKEIEDRVKIDPIYKKYLGGFFSDCKTEDDKRELVKPYFLMTTYIDETTREKRRSLSLRPPKRIHSKSKSDRRTQRVIDAMICTLFFDMLQREYPEFSEIVSKTYTTKLQKTAQYDQMSKGEALLVHFISNYLKRNYNISCIRKHDAIVTLFDPNNKKASTLFDPIIGKPLRENIIWNAFNSVSPSFS